MVDIIAVFNEWPLLEQAHQVINRLQAVGFGSFYRKRNSLFLVDK